MNLGPFLFLPIDGSGPYYAMVYHKFTRSPFADFFAMDGGPLKVRTPLHARMLSIPMRFVHAYGTFVRLGIAMPLSVSVAGLGRGPECERLSVIPKPEWWNVDSSDEHHSDECESVGEHKRIDPILRQIMEWSWRERGEQHRDELSIGGDAAANGRRDAERPGAEPVKLPVRPSRQRQRHSTKRDKCAVLVP